MLIKADMYAAGESNYDYETVSVSPSGTNTVQIHDGMVTIAPTRYESSQFEGCWYIKKGVLTKIYQNSSAKCTVTYANDILTVKNNTTGYSMSIWVYKEQS